MKKYLTNGKPRKKWTEEEKKQYAEKLKGKKRGTYKNKGRSLSEEHKEKLRGKRSNNGI